MAVSLLLGVTILVLALPRLVAGLIMFPGDHVLLTITHRLPAEPNDLETLLAARQSSLAWTTSGHPRLELATAAMLLAEQEVGGGPRYHALMQQAIAALRDGLARGPADPYGWTRLAYAELAENAPARQIIPDLTMAIETAPVAPDLTFPRLELCLLEWPYFAHADPILFEQQVRIAWHQSNQRLVNLALKTGRRDAVRDALAENDRANFERLIDP